MNARTPANAAAREAAAMGGKPFRGAIRLDLRDCNPHWEPYNPAKAPEGSPDILIIPYDATGLVAWSAYGDRINEPTLRKRADTRTTEGQGIVDACWRVLVVKKVQQRTVRSCQQFS